VILSEAPEGIVIAPAVCTSRWRATADRGRGVDLVQASKDGVAGSLAAAANFRAETAVLVVGGVKVALLGAGDACGRAGFDGRAKEPEVRTGLAHGEARSRVAVVGTVEAEANHTDHRLHVVLAQAGVCAGRAACPAI